jgi:hypothetical protein
MRDPIIADPMTPPVVTVSPATPFKRLVTVLTHYRIGSVPVLDLLWCVSTRRSGLVCPKSPPAVVRGMNAIRLP